jgi:DNA polymerase/3'-5' exonuclease PolX
MNQKIVSYLKKLENMATNKDEVYRQRAFKKARQVIGSLDFELKNINQLKGRVGIGKGTLQRIAEILETGKLQEVDEKFTDEKEEVIEKFMKIHGVGEKTAQRWYEKGHRDIKDLIKHEKLTSAQKIGIKYIEDLDQRVPRENITDIDNILQQTVKELNREFNLHLECIIAGSYRRNTPDSGDIDCLMANKSGKLGDREIDLFLDRFRHKGLLTDELGRGENKFIGVCVDKDGIHRRIDFEFCRDYVNFPYELVYFTGSQQNNLDMRQKAKDMGMLLNQNGLWRGEKLIPAKTEKDVFMNIGMRYIKPEDR